MDEQRRPLPARARRTSLVVVAFGATLAIDRVAIHSAIGGPTPLRASTLRKISRVVGAGWSSPQGMQQANTNRNRWENEQNKIKVEPSEIKTDSATAIRPILVNRYCHPTFDHFGAPRSKQRHRSNQKKSDFRRQRKNQRRASKHVLGPRKSRSISVRKHGANAV